MVKIGLCCEKTTGEKPKTSPLPWGKILVLSFVLFVNQFGATMIVSYLPYMVHDYFPELNNQEIGKMSGYMESAFFIGNFAGSMIWGWLSDILGRRLVILLGLTGTIFSQLMFGFSQNFGWATASRFLWGILNGNLGVVKTYVSDICDDTNQATGFAVLGTTVGISRIVGAVAGGFLAEPASKYGALQVPFFCKFPYVLPCMLGGAISILSLIVACVFLNETLYIKKKDGSYREQEEISDQTNFLQDSCSSDTDMPKEDTERVKKEGSDAERLEQNGGVVETGDSWCMSCVTCCTHHEKCTPQNARSFVMEKSNAGIEKMKMMVILLRDRRMLLSTMLNGLTACIAIISSELFPLLMVTDHKHGGYRMDTNEIGIALMAIGVCQLLGQVIVFPRITSYLGYRWTFRLGTLVFAAACMVLPFSNQITGSVPMPASTTCGSGSGFESGWQNTDYCGNILDVSLNEHSVLRIPAYIWIFVIGITSLIAVSRVTSITINTILISNSALPAVRGMVNGIGQAFAALGYVVGPMAGPPLFAWSANYGSSWPLNFHLAFDLLAVSAILTTAVSLFLPQTIEKKRDAID